MTDLLNAKTLIGALIGITIAMVLAAALWPEVETAGDTLNTSGIGLGNLFAGTLLGIIVGAAILFGVLKAVGVV